MSGRLDVNVWNPVALWFVKILSAIPVGMAAIEGTRAEKPLMKVDEEGVDCGLAEAGTGMLGGRMGGRGGAMEPVVCGVI